MTCRELVILIKMIVAGKNHEIIIIKTNDAIANVTCNKERSWSIDLSNTLVREIKVHIDYSIYYALTLLTAWLVRSKHIEV